MIENLSELASRLLSAFDVIARAPVPDHGHPLAVLRLRMIRQLAAAVMGGQWDRVEAIADQLDGARSGTRLGFQFERDGRYYGGIAGQEERQGRHHYYWLVIRDDGAEARVPDESLTLTDDEIVARARDEWHHGHP